jgi:hypothetical protein
LDEPNRRDASNSYNIYTIGAIPIPRIADIPIYIADPAVRFNGEKPLVGGNVRLAVPSKVDPLLARIGLTPNVSGGI